MSDFDFMNGDLPSDSGKPAEPQHPVGIKFYHPPADMLVGEAASLDLSKTVENGEFSLRSFDFMDGQLPSDSVPVDDTVVSPAVTKEKFLSSDDEQDLFNAGLLEANLPLQKKLYELAVVDNYEKMLTEMLKIVKKTGEQLVNALLDDDEFVQMQNVRLNIPKDETKVVVTKIEALIKERGLTTDNLLKAPVTMYKTEKIVASFIDKDLGIASVESSDDHSWIGLVQKTINYQSLNSRVKEFISTIETDELMTVEVIKSHLPDFLKDNLNIFQEFDVVTRKASAK